MNANHLRQRARHLRDLANSIESLSVMSLEGHADDDTWRGQRPMLCRWTLGTNQQQLYAATDDLRSHALRFERQAAELDAIAAARVGVAV